MVSLEGQRWYLYFFSLDEGNDQGWIVTRCFILLDIIQIKLHPTLVYK